jgi:hypothetical protein
MQPYIALGAIVGEIRPAVLTCAWFAVAAAAATTACAARRASAPAGARPWSGSPSAATSGGTAADFAEGRWRRLESARFTLTTDWPLPEAQRILRDLDEYFQALITVCFEGAAPGTERIPVIALATREITRRYLVSWSSGVFIAQLPYQPLIVLGVGESGYSDAIVRHELVHYAMQLAQRRELPLWYGEGVASYFQTLAYDRAGRRLLVGRAELGRVHALREKGPLLPADDLIDGLLDTAIDTEPERFYATSWLLAHMLIHQAPAVFSAYERALLQGVTSAEAWARSSPPALRSAIDGLLARYFKEKRYEVGRRLPWEAAPVALTPVALAPADLLATEALLHAVGARQQPEQRAGHFEAASRLVAAALRQEPAHLAALQVALALEQRPSVEAARAALRGREQSWIAWLLLFDVLSATADPSVEVERRAALARAAALAPAEPAVAVARGLGPGRAHRGMLPLGRGATAAHRRDHRGAHP